MSKRSLDFLVGGVILAILLLKAPDILVCGLGYAWWKARRSTGEAGINEMARAAMLGGVAARLLLAVLFLAALPLFSTLKAMPTPSFLFVQGASMLGLGILVVGTLSLVEAFCLGLAIRLLGPWLPR